MNPNTVPRFVKDPKTWQLKVSATTPRATPLGEGTTFGMFTGAANGSRVDHIRLQAQGEVADSQLYIFKLGVGGVTHLFAEVAISASSAGSGKITDFEAELTPTKPLYLLEGEVLLAGVNTTTATLSIFVTGGDF